MKKECFIKFPKIFQVEPILIISEFFYSEKRLEMEFNPTSNPDLFNIISNWMRQIHRQAQMVRAIDYNNYKGSLIVDGICITEGLFPINFYWMENSIVKIEFSYDILDLTSLVIPEPKILEIPILEGIDYEKQLAVEWDLEFENLLKDDKI